MKVDQPLLFEELFDQKFDDPTFWADEQVIHIQCPEPNWNLSRYFMKRVTPAHRWKDNPEVLTYMKELASQLRSSKKVIRKQRKRKTMKTKVNNETVQIEKLPDRVKGAYERVQQAIAANPQLGTRLLRYENLKTMGLSQRDVNFFITHYAREKSLSYYIDITEYPHKLVGKVNDPNDVEAKALIAQGRNVKFIHVYSSYHHVTGWNGGSFRPHRSGVRIRDASGKIWVMSWCNFYIWFDAICGYEAYKQCMNGSMPMKKQFDLASLGRSAKRKKEGKESVKRAVGKRSNYSLLYGVDEARNIQNTIAIMQSATKLSNIPMPKLKQKATDSTNMV